MDKYSYSSSLFNQRHKVLSDTISDFFNPLLYSKCSSNRPVTNSPGDKLTICLPTNCLCSVCVAFARQIIHKRNNFMSLNIGLFMIFRCTRNHPFIPDPPPHLCLIAVITAAGKCLTYSQTVMRNPYTSSWYLNMLCRALNWLFNASSDSSALRYLPSARSLSNFRSDTLPRAVSGMRVTLDPSALNLKISLDSSMR